MKEELLLCSDVLEHHSCSQFLTSLTLTTDLTHCRQIGPHQMAQVAETACPEVCAQERDWSGTVQVQDIGKRDTKLLTHLLSRASASPPIKEPIKHLHLPTMTEGWNPPNFIENPMASFYFIDATYNPCDFGSHFTSGRLIYGCAKNRSRSPTSESSITDVWNSLACQMDF
jgi:hypothetical protein